MMIVDACYSVHLGMKIKKVSDNLTVRFDQFKDELKEAPEGSAKSKFYGTMIDIKANNDSLREAVRKHVQSLQKPKMWWKKNKDTETVENKETDKKD